MLVSYPPPPGPQDPRPQDRPSELPSWQQQPYHPQSGNWAAPPYGGPPRKSRAGLIIVLIVVLVLAILGIGGFVTYTLTSSDNGSGTAPAPSPSAAPVSTPTRKATPPAPPKTVPSVAPTKAVPTKVVPTKMVPSKPVGTSGADAVALAGRFVAQLNADNTEAAIAMGCTETRSLIPTLISALIKAPTKLTVTSAAIGQNPYIVQISGTTKGQTMSGMIIVQDTCIRVFQLTPS